MSNKTVVHIPPEYGDEEAIIENISPQDTINELFALLIKWRGKQFPPNVYLYNSRNIKFLPNKKILSISVRENRERALFVRKAPW